MTLRVVLVDDTADLRLLLRTALEAGGRVSVVGEAANGADAVEAVVPGAAEKAVAAAFTTARATSWATGRPVAMDTPRSPCSTCHSQIAYWTGRGLSNP